MRKREEARIGVWICDTNIILRTFRGTNLLEEAGSNIATSVAAPTLGRWRHLDGRRYFAIGRFFRYDAAN